jgi:hypothetical protein
MIWMKQKWSYRLCWKQRPTTISNQTMTLISEVCLAFIKFVSTTENFLFNFCFKISDFPGKSSFSFVHYSQFICRTKHEVLLFYLMAYCDILIPSCSVPFITVTIFYTIRLSSPFAEIFLTIHIFLFISEKKPLKNIIIIFNIQ